MTHLTGLTPDQIMDEAKVREAIENAVASRLFANIAYDYEAQPNSADVTDELPLLPVTIAVPGVDAEAIWKYLTDFDLFFASEMPPSAKAVRSGTSTNTSTASATRISELQEMSREPVRRRAEFQGVKVRSIKR